MVRVYAKTPLTGVRASLDIRHLFDFGQKHYLKSASELLSELYSKGECKKNILTALMHVGRLRVFSPVYIEVSASRSD